MAKLTEIFFALSNQSRLNIYTLVLKGEKNITEISGKLKQKYPNVLKNLKILKNAGMITIDKRVTETSQSSFIKGIPFREGTVYEKVYLKLLEEN